jgi:uncharacterized protein (DUF433 family)
MLMKPLAVGEFLVVDTRICHGKLTFKGTRVPVEAVLAFLAQGETIEQILQSWPELKRVAVEEAIRLAAAAWPELLREPVEKAIRPLAAALTKRQTRSADALHEPAHPGRSA